MLLFYKILSQNLLGKMVCLGLKCDDNYFNQQKNAMNIALQEKETAPQLILSSLQLFHSNEIQYLIVSFLQAHAVSSPPPIPFNGLTLSLTAKDKFCLSLGCWQVLSLFPEEWLYKYCPPDTHYNLPSFYVYFF